jgi:hypothetical protein
MSIAPLGTGRHWSFRPRRRAAVQRPVSKRMRIAGACLRAAFIILLVVATVHASLPQSETLWTVYDTPGDLIRLALGLGVCIWGVIQLFTLPKDKGDGQAYRAWFYIGLPAVPFLIICIIGTW